MNPPLYRVRRATIEDFPRLIALWQSMNLSTAELQSQLTQFQLVESNDGALLGALALEKIDLNGRLHSEVFVDFGLADELRELLWARMQSVATNYGLARLWTDETAPFWKYNGFQIANTAALKKLPAAWTEQARSWQTLPLRDEEALHTSLNVEFERFKEEAAKQAGPSLNPARTLNNLAMILAVLLAIAIAIFCVYLLKHSPGIR